VLVEIEPLTSGLHRHGVDSHHGREGNPFGNARCRQRREDLGAALAGDLHYLPEEEFNMLLALALIIGIAWLLGFTVFHVTAGAIHVLLVVAVVVAIVHFMQGRRAPL
jgi:hypothetical protein